MKHKSSLKTVGYALCRTPLFSPYADIKDKLAELKPAILESSPDFHELIKSVTPDEIEDLDLKIRFTLWKYFNRAKYRATPFGQFSAISAIPVAPAPTGEPIRLKKELVLHRLTDWSEKDNAALASTLGPGSKIMANLTFYPCGDEIRYITKQDGLFELTAIQNIPLVLGLLDFCRSPSDMTAVGDFISQQAAYSKHTAARLIRELVDLQLLYSDGSPNITGEDYFERRHIKMVPETKPYTIAERPLLAGSLKEAELNALKEAIDFLAMVSPQGRQTELDRFKAGFLKKFANHEVSFLTALDPEIGVSYANLDQSAAKGGVLDSLKEISNDTSSPEQSIIYGPLHKFLLNKLTAYKPGTGLAIQLEELDWKESDSGNKIPNSLSAIIQFSDELIILQSAGGTTANGLLGRFTVASQIIEETGKLIARLEEEANPDILFFDIAYQSEKLVDNVNRRKHLYPHEMALLCWSTHPNQIDPADLLVSVKNNEVIIRSIKHNKRLIPRIASAYNYLRSDLSMYRFLCDLQHQHLLTSLSFSLQGCFPGLDHYPRIQYKKVVLSAASWLVPERFNDKKVPLAERSADLKLWLEAIGIGRFFKAGSSDQTLCFDTQNPEELLFFLLFKQKYKSLYINEALLPSSSLVTDESGDQYLAEFIVNFHHNEKVIEALNLPAGSLIDKPKMDVRLPGSEWLYFELYCHAESSDLILLTTIAPLVRQLEKKISKWFFIRYTDPSYHIRLRFKLKPGINGFEVISQVSTQLELLLKEGRISDIQLKSYDREVFRYGAAIMDNTESIFCLDSNYILKLLNKQMSVTALYSHAIHTMLAIMDSIAIDTKTQINFTKNIADSMGNEHHINIEGFKKINEYFRTEILNTPDILLKRSEKSSYTEFRNKIIAHLKNLQPGMQLKILADLFHMHVNRLFNQDQRMHEMLIYQYAVKMIRIKSSR
jgi:thiopeptide-type bacteriocin biosynthesis protein